MRIPFQFHEEEQREEEGEGNNNKGDNLGLIMLNNIQFQKALTFENFKK